MSRRGMLSSEEMESLYPYTSKVFLRTPWETREHLKVNGCLATLTNDHRIGHWNGIACYRFARQKQASEFTDFIRSSRLHRLRRDCRDGAGQSEVALEWRRVFEERRAILAWGRAMESARCRTTESTRCRTMEVVYTYRFERRRGIASREAHEAAGETVALLDPAVADPLNHAGVLIEWAEREHRPWFWRCCRDGHSL